LSYISDALMPGEQIEIQARHHWIIFIKAALLLFLSLFLFSSSASTQYRDSAHLLRFGGYAFLAFGIINGLISLVDFITSEYAVTNMRVIIKEGLIWRKATEIVLSQVESIKIDQKILGRMLGYGSILIMGSGGTSERYHFISDPLAFRDVLHAHVARIQMR